MGPAEWDGQETLSLVEQTIHSGSANGGKPDR